MFSLLMINVICKISAGSEVRYFAFCQHVESTWFYKSNNLSGMGSIYKSFIVIQVFFCHLSQKSDFISCNFNYVFLFLYLIFYPHIKNVFKGLLNCYSNMFLDFVWLNRSKLQHKSQTVINISDKKAIFVTCLFWQIRNVDIDERFAAHYVCL